MAYRLEVVRYPAPILLQRSKEIKVFTPELQKFIDNMIETMIAHRFAGLAAPQVNLPVRIITVKIGRMFRSENLAVINPVITYSEGSVWGREGCGSLPRGLWLPVRRARKITVKGLRRDEQSFEMTFEGMVARAFQHEIDHLDGTLIIDYQ